MSINVIFCLLVCIFIAQTQASSRISMSDKSHNKREISENTAIPQLSLSLFKDASNGYNLYLSLVNYQIQPPELSQIKGVLNVPLEGHAHLYINGIKIGRLYGVYYHLPEKMFNAGVNNIKVTLNSHDHAVWIVQDKEVLSSLMINTLKEDFILYQFDTQAVK